MTEQAIGTQRGGVVTRAAGPCAHAGFITLSTTGRPPPRAAL